jgi:hypothetical protein
MALLPQLVQSSPHVNSGGGPVIVAHGPDIETDQGGGAAQTEM